MKFCGQLYIRAREGLTAHLGQTATEYALILACIAIVVYAGYELMGQDISSTVSGITNTVTSA